MVSKRREQYREISYTDLAKEAHVHDDANRAVARYSALAANGIQPVILHSDFNGYRICTSGEAYQLLDG